MEPSILHYRILQFQGPGLHVKLETQLLGWRQEQEVNKEVVILNWKRLYPVVD